MYIAAATALPVGLVQTTVLMELAGERAAEGHCQTRTFPTEYEDTLTLAVAATSQLLMPEVRPQALYLGSETPLYAVKPTSSLIAYYLGLETVAHAADMEFACRAGTQALLAVRSMIGAGEINSGLAVAADCAQGAIGDPLFVSTGAGAAAFLLTAEQTGLSRAQFLAGRSGTTSGHHDFWRAHGRDHPSHAGRYSAQSYRDHVTAAIEDYLHVTDTIISDYDIVILHQPNTKQPQQVAQQLGISADQLERGWIYELTGNTYAACVPMAFAAALSQAHKGERILVCSYGSGAGSDCFAVEVTRDYDQQIDPLPLHQQHARLKQYHLSEVAQMLLAHQS